MTAIELVLAWCTNWPGVGPEEASHYFSPDAEWINVPAPDRVTVGPEAIATELARFTKRFAHVSVQVHHAAESADGVVLVERSETFVFPGGTSFQLPVAAVFELRDGRITSWRDYFDMAQFTSQMPSSRA